ncbi:hypothetical protein LAZ67_5001938, partial [Cordylochernes scorpioides]
MSEHSRNISNQDTRSLLYQYTLNTGHSFNTNHPTIHYRHIHNQHQRLVLESIESHRHNSINRKIELPDAYRALLALHVMQSRVNIDADRKIERGMGGNKERQRVPIRDSRWEMMEEDRWDLSLPATYIAFIRLQLMLTYI